MLPWTPPNTEDVEPLPVGRWWDAVRVAPTVAGRALGALGEASGAVIQDIYGTLYWLVAVGSVRDRRLRHVRVLPALADESTYLGVPPASWTEGPGPHWRVPLTHGPCLTDAEALWTALTEVVRAGLGGVPEGRQLCYRCQLPTDEPIIVGDEHGGSVGGGTIYVCAQHASYYPEHGRIPLFPARGQGGGI
ncbi:hypothetical protein JK363_33980 [Streptomyces sp. 205]|uniref:Uncharacterized protein n=1 Tax=Streptomyces coffeae TaxID=621382 RepID=A0ABS1NN96_9ACTN|nr:hypothetical protein [Streptomyces coffeae]